MLQRLASGVKFAVGAEKDMLLPSQVLDNDGAIIWVHHLKDDWKFESGIEHSVGDLHYCAIRDDNVRGLPFLTSQIKVVYLHKVADHPKIIGHY